MGRVKLKMAVVLASTACLVVLVWTAVGSSQDGKNPQIEKVQPAVAKPIQIRPLPPEREDQKKPIGGPGGGGGPAQPPEIRPVPHSWEYRVVEFVGRDAKEHTKLLNQLASEGWEYVGLVNIYVTQTNGTTNGQPSALVAFRRPTFRVLPVQPPRIQPLPKVPPGTPPEPAPARPLPPEEQFRLGPLTPPQIQPAVRKPILRPVPPEREDPKKPAEDAAGGGRPGQAQPGRLLPALPARMEYRVVEFVGRDANEHTKLLNQLASEGWQYVGPINVYTTQTKGTTNGQPTSLIAFRRSGIREAPGPLPVQPLPAPVPSIFQGAVEP